jgi:folate-binding protein YgfZ
MQKSTCIPRHAAYLGSMKNPCLTNRAVLRLSPAQDGEDVRSFLQGLVTQDMKGAFPAWAGLLSPQGKALFDFILWVDGDDILIDCEAEAADALTKRLSLYRLRRKISIAPDPGLAVYWSIEQRDGAAADPRMPDLMGYRWLAVPSGDDMDCSDVYRAHRLTHGITEGQAELGYDQTLWLEANAAELNGVSFNKGCYVGQENTARMNWRAKVNRRMVVLPTALSNPKRHRITYADLGLSVEQWRTEDIKKLDLPSWLAAAINEDEADAS